jgi:acyl-CoA synthetase (AMP-forming)/AMP-acid ligase II
MAMDLTQPLHKALYERPTATALVCGERRSTFAQFVDRVARLAAVLQSLGVQPGDRVGLLSLNSDRYVEYLYATWWAGGVINPVNIRWSAREIAYSLDDCDTRILLTDAHFGVAAQQQHVLSRSLKTLVYFGDGPAPEGMADAQALMAQAQPAPDARRGGADLAAVMYTGGTTGQPKGVMLTHANLYASQLSANMAATRPAEAVGLNMAPMFHVGGAGLTLQLMMRLCTQIIIPAFDEVKVLEAIQNERASETFMVPTILKRRDRVVEIDGYVLCIERLPQASGRTTPPPPSARCHPDRSVQPHALAVEVPVGNHQLGQRRVLGRVAQALGERHRRGQRGLHVVGRALQQRRVEDARQDGVHADALAHEVARDR